MYSCILYYTSDSVGPSIPILILNKTNICRYNGSPRNQKPVKIIINIEFVYDLFFPIHFAGFIFGQSFGRSSSLKINKLDEFSERSLKLNLFYP